MECAGRGPMSLLSFEVEYPTSLAPDIETPGSSPSDSTSPQALLLPTGRGFAGSSFRLGVASQALPPDWECHCKHSSDLAAPDFKALQFVSEITVGSWDSSTSITI